MGHVIDITTGTARVRGVRLLPSGQVGAGADPRVEASAGVVQPVH